MSRDATTLPPDSGWDSLKFIFCCLITTMLRRFEVISSKLGVRLNSAVAQAAALGEMNSYKESATYKFRQQRSAAIQARRQEAKMAQMADTTGKAAPVAVKGGNFRKKAASALPVEKVVPAPVSRRSGKPMYMVKKPISSADAFRAHRQKVRAGVVGEEFEAPRFDEETRESEREQSSGSAYDGVGGESTSINFGKAFMMMAATGVAVEAAVFYAKESKVNPPGKLIQLYRYVWEKRFNDALKLVTK